MHHHNRLEAARRLDGVARISLSWAGSVRPLMGRKAMVCIVPSRSFPENRVLLLSTRINWQFCPARVFELKGACRASHVAVFTS